MAESIMLLFMSVSAAQVPEPPPLTSEQRERIGKLAGETQREAARLKSLLEARQLELNRLYTKYELDEKEAKVIEDDILNIQKQLLANYRTMQVELRTHVGKERFVILKQRLNNLFKTPEKKTETPKP